LGVSAPAGPQRLRPFRYDAFEEMTRLPDPDEFPRDAWTRLRRQCGMPFGGPQSEYAIDGRPAADGRRLRVYLASEDDWRVTRAPIRRGAHSRLAK
jgi:hypothetical protein